MTGRTKAALASTAIHNAAVFEPLPNLLQRLVEVRYDIVNVLYAH